MSNYNATTNGQVVVYAYKKGRFNKSSEIKAQGDSGITFKNATTSTKVDGLGNFKIAFLEEADYELHFATNKKRSYWFIKYFFAAQQLPVFFRYLFQTTIVGQHT